MVAKPIIREKITHDQALEIVYDTLHDQNKSFTPDNFNSLWDDKEFWKQRNFKRVNNIKINQYYKK